MFNMLWIVLFKVGGFGKMLGMGYIYRVKKVFRFVSKFEGF